MSIISNLKNLAQNSLRRKALLIAEAGYESISIEKITSERIKIKDNLLKIGHTAFFNGKKSEIEQNFDDFEKIYIVGIGKGSALAIMSLAKILGKKLTGGIALDISGVKCRISKVRCFRGTHPLPSKQNIIATQEIIKLAESLTEKDLLITFICGGGSALACASEEELKNSGLATKELTKAGANINELNTIRKHLSEFKGGGLAKMAYPATVISLIISDVCGNDLSNVASGPTVFNKTTKIDAEKILKKYGIDAGKFCLNEQLKEQKYFKKVKNILFSCNQDAITGIIGKAEKLGLSVKIYSLALEGEAKNAFAPILKQIKSGEAIIAAGETTVTLTNNQRPTTNNIIKGGRNQEAVLGSLVKCQISDVKCLDAVFLSFASDGRDNTEAAGAIGDYLTIEKAKKLKLNPKEFLKNHDSFNFFNKTGDLIYANQKCFNVADLMFVLRASKE